MLNKITIDFYAKDNLEIRKQNGIYMTPYNITEKCFENEDIKLYDNILEPSFGSGQFIDTMLKLNKKLNITGIEINNDLFENVKQNYSKNKKNIKLINHDFLTLKFDSNNKFDLIVGNPPYFEMNITDEHKNTFSDIISGRVNIYSLFIYKCINLLKEKGKLIFVIPTSLLSSKYFEKLRFFIQKTCNITEITLLGTKDFSDALQSTMIFKIQKLEANTISNNKFIVQFDNTIIFTNKYIDINNLIKDKKFIKDFDCKVKTGNIVWNQHKNKLSNEKNLNTFLVYPRNLVDGEIVEINDNVKKQFIKIDKNSFKGPLIAINRIVGINSISLKPVLIKSGDIEYFFENHINVITGKLSDLTIIYNSLIKPETINFIKNIIGNTQLSKNELLYMIPIF